MLGTLPEKEAQTIAEHLETCVACETTIAELESRDEPLIAALRQQVPASPELESPEYREALARAEAAFATASEPAAKGEGEDLPDNVQLGDYELLAKLGQGGMGAVYRARHVRLKRVVALKVLKKDRLQDQNALARFEREIEAVGQLEHPSIVRAYDAREVEGQHFLVMEYVDGLDLTHVVERVRALPFADACEAIRQAALGLQCAHEHGLVHRDIKPSNLMLSRLGQVKVLDMGLALLNSDGSAGGELTGAGQVMGTADYMAPEQATDSHAVDIRADIYSLGCTLYKLLTGRAPFAVDGLRTVLEKLTAHVLRPFPDVTEVRNDVPQALAALLGRMVAKNPAERFATPAEVATALEAFCQGNDLPGLYGAATSKSALETRPGQLAPSTFNLVSSAESSTATQCQQAPEPAVAGGRRRRPPRVLVALGLAPLAFFFLAGAIIYIKNTRVEVPEGAEVRIGDKGELAVTLPEKPVAKPAEKPAEGRRDGWTPSPAEDSLPGIIPRPAKIPGIHRWQVETAEWRPGNLGDVAWHPDGRSLALPSGNALRLINPESLVTERIVLGCRDYVKWPTWTPDGRALLAAQDWYPIRVWGADGTPIHEIGHGLTNMTLTPDGTRIVGRGRDNRISGWSFDGKRQLPLAGYWGAYALSPDGKWLALRQDNGTVSLRQLDGKQGPELEKKAWRSKEPWSGWNLAGIAWNPDSQRLACMRDDGKISFWDLDGRAGAVLEGHPGGVTILAWSPDGRQLASGGNDTRVRLWSSSGEPGPVLEGHSQAIKSVAWSPNGKYLASNDDDAVRIWQLAPQPQLVKTSPYPAAHHVVWSPDSRQLICPNWMGDVRIVPVEGPTRTARAVVDKPYVSWNLDGSRLLSFHGGLNTVCIWNGDGVLVQQESNVVRSSWQADCRYLALRNDNEIRIFDTSNTNPDPPRTIQGIEGWDRYERCWSPDRSMTAAAAGKNVQLWKVDGTPLRTLEGHAAEVSVITWSPDGQLLGSLARGGEVRLWKADGTLRCSFQVVDQAAQSLAFRPDGEHLAILSPQAMHIRTLDGQAVRTQNTPNRQSFTWAPRGGRYAWSSSFGGLAPEAALHLEDVQGHRLPLEVIENYHVRLVNWSPNGRDLAMASVDGPVRVWDVEANRPRWVVLPFIDGTHVTFTPAGQILEGEPPVCEKQLVYVVQRTPNGPQELWTFKQFAEFVKQAGMDLRAPR